MKLFVKRLTENAELPKFAYNTDAGMDLTASWIRETEKFVEYGTGIAVQIQRPENEKDFDSYEYFLKIYPRSSISNYDLTLSNSAGIIDFGYTGEIIFRFRRVPNIFHLIKSFFEEVKKSIKGKEPIKAIANYLMNFDPKEFEKNNSRYYKVGDKIGQAIIEKRPYVEIIEVDSLRETERGSGGYGSTGV